MAQLLKGAPVAQAMTERLSSRVQALSRDGVVPKLAIVRVGERPDDLSYERAAVSRAERLGIAVERIVLDARCSQEELLAAIGRVNDDDSTHGCLVFRPLPSQLDEAVVSAALDPAKDVDGITPGSLFGVFAGRPLGFPPCTAEAVLALLDHYGYELSGRDVCVVGRSLVIGRPVSMLLEERDATVTLCHSRTRDLASRCRQSDLVVVATGHAGTVGAASAREGQYVVDVGFNWDPVEGRAVGDVDFDAVEGIVEAISPVPGGVGSITTAVLCEHVVAAAEKRRR